VRSLLKPVLLKRAPLKPALLLSVVLLAASACKREAEVPAPPVPGQTAPAETVAGPAAAIPELKDVIETNDSYIVGISYPATINKYPGLAQAVSAYADSARAELMQAVAGFGNDKPSAPYELSLGFEQVVETPQLVAIAADGSRYTGGAHGEPLVARFVWLPAQNKLLTAKELVPRVEGWVAIGAYIREQLHTSVSVRADADEMPPQERLEFVRSADKMIDEGTEPDADNFAAFQPIVDAQGRITALRFVFPPYQVGPYADGTQTVDVPAAILLPHLAPEYSGLFAKS